MRRYIDLDQAFMLLDRREKQLKRVLKSAREWMHDAYKLADILAEEYDSMGEPEDV